MNKNTKKVNVACKYKEEPSEFGVIEKNEDPEKFSNILENYFSSWVGKCTVLL